MRRGHSRGSWRMEQPRQFRPRHGGIPGFRPPRPLLAGPRGPPRYPPPLHFRPRPPYRPHEPFPINIEPNIDQPPPKIQNIYHWDNKSNSSINYHQRNYPENQTRPEFSLMHQRSQQQSSFVDDINERKGFILSKPTPRHKLFEKNFDRDNKSFGQLHPPIFTPKSISCEIDRFTHQTYDNVCKQQDFAMQSNNYGRRPHSSDYYEGNSAPSEESKTFSRSIGDTVNIIKQRLIKRSDSSNSSLPKSPNYNDNDCNDDFSNLARKEYHNTNTQQEQNPKKKSHKINYTVKSNCHKIKNKILNQLFKMDKDNIHKLMDNPNLSSKFEYAIDSLVMESQNSLNSHTRAAAEKSLYGNTNDRLQFNENIYEDTFMKHMQCVLDPQDTIFFTDLKPIVMAEINRVLQLDNCDQIGGILEDDDMLCVQRENLNVTSKNDTIYKDNYGEDNYEYDTEDYYNEKFNSQEARSYDHSHYDELQYGHEDAEDKINRNLVSVNQVDANVQALNHSLISESITESRDSAKHIDYSKEKRISADRRRNSANIKEENLLVDNNDITYSNIPLFDGTESLSGDEDPFAEFDKQYHVAVDPNFIKVDDPDDLQSNMSRENTLDNTTLFKSENKINCKESSVKNEDISNIKTIYTNKCIDQAIDNISSSLDQVDNNVQDTRVTSNSRKRSSDEQPSHRKEKKKKSDTIKADSKQILNKNIIINVNECKPKINDNDSNTNSVVNLFFSKDESGDMNKERPDKVDVLYADKYVKRKESRGNHSTKKKKKSSKDKNYSSQCSDDSHSSTKLDKNKLKPIDMFEQRPRKVQLHQAPRNTASYVDDLSESAALKHKRKSSENSNHAKVSTKSVSTQVSKKICSKETQTTANKCQNSVRNKTTQTDKITKSNDVFERMKEIDLEITVLMEEKIKLYRSIETQHTMYQSTIPNLGISVFNVPPIEETKADDVVTESTEEDKIIENLTMLSEEELEKIAFEGVQGNDGIATDFVIETTPKREKRGKNKKVVSDDANNCNQAKTKPKKRGRKKKTVIQNEAILGGNNLDDNKPLEQFTSVKKSVLSPVKTRKRRNLLTPKDPVALTSSSCIKRCYVLLNRIDLETAKNTLDITKKFHNVSKKSQETDNANQINTCGESINDMNVIMEENVSVINEIDFHDDMMGISEDIVIGSDCEVTESVKTLDLSENDCLVTSDDVVDNSCGKSVEEATYVEKSRETSGCKIFDYSDEDLKKDSITVTGHADAILAIECVERNFLASSLDGNVYYYNSEGHLLATLKGSNFAVTCLTIVKEKHGTTVYTGSLDSRIRYFDIETGLERGPECNVLSPIQTMDRAWGTIFVGTRTGFVLQFECKNNMLIPVSTIKFSDQSILALRALKEGPRKVLLVAARSENVTVKDAQTGLLLRTLVGPKMTVYTLLYEEGKIYCGTSTNQIQAFDYASGSYVGSHEGGKGAVCLRAAGGLVFAGCYDGFVYVFRAGERTPTALLRGPSVMLLSLAVVGTNVIAGYKDRSLYIWKIPLYILQEMVL